MNKQKKHIDSHVWGIIGSVVFQALLLLLMFFLIFPVPELQPNEEEGLTVNYGFSNDGDGLFEPAPQSAVENQLVDAEPEVTEPVPANAPTPTATEELITQEDPETLAMKAAQEKEKELERQRAQEEAARKAAEEARKKAEAEAKRQKEEAAKAKAAAATKNAFSGNGSGGTGSSNASTGQGNTGKSGNQGNPFGDPNSSNLTGGGRGNGSSWSLSGRTISGTLPEPVSKNNEVGVVVVGFEVDSNGNVVSVKAGAKGTDTYDKELWSAAEAAAKKAKFNAISNSTVQSGTITYKFVH